MYKIMKNREIVASNIPTFDLACKMARSLGDCWILSPSGGIAREYTNDDIELFLLEQTLLSGVNIEYNRLSLIDLTEVRKFPQYQVYADYARMQHNELYDDPKEACRAFMELRGKIKR